MADNLLGDGAAADRSRIRVAEVGDDGRHQRRRVEADVLVEGVVLHGDGSFDEMTRNLVERHAGALAFAEYLPQHLAVAVCDLGCLEGLAIAGRLQAGDAGFDLARPVGVDEAAGRGRAADDDQQEQGDDAQNCAADAAAAAFGAGRRRRGGNVLNGRLRVILHINIDEL